MTRAEHLQWAKARAIAEYDHSGKPGEAVASIQSDLGKHPETQSSARMIGSLGVMLAAAGQLQTRAQVVDFINGVN